MMRRKWMFWLQDEPENQVSSASLGADTEACREWTPFLTALFDGEADEEGALRARRHLLVCERCARAWMDWNQTRSLLVNHSAPPPPPTLLWRVRLACRLGQPSQPRVPELSAQILARTTRQNRKPAFAGFASSLMPRGFRLNSPFVGALALGAFVVFLSRDSLLLAPPAPQNDSRAASFSARVPRPEAQPGSAIETPTEEAEPLILEPREQPVPSRAKATLPVLPVRVAAAPERKNTIISGSSASLLRARRERETLASVPIRSVAYDVGEPLPMLQSPRIIERAPKQKRALRIAVPAKLAGQPRTLPRPVASSPRIAAPVVLLASAAVASPESSVSSSLRSGRSSRVVLASAPVDGTRLRISAPRALPLTMTQPANSDDAGWEELDSTVQEYRATLADDYESDSESG